MPNLVPLRTPSVLITQNILLFVFLFLNTSLQEKSEITQQYIKVGWYGTDMQNNVNVTLKTANIAVIPWSWWCHTEPSREFCSARPWSAVFDLKAHHCLHKTQHQLHKTQMQRSKQVKRMTEEDIRIDSEVCSEGAHLYCALSRQGFDQIQLAYNPCQHSLSRMVPLSSLWLKCSKWEKLWCVVNAESKRQVNKGKFSCANITVSVLESIWQSPRIHCNQRSLFFSQTPAEAACPV